MHPLQGLYLHFVNLLPSMTSMFSVRHQAINFFDALIPRGGVKMSRYIVDRVVVVNADYDVNVAINTVAT